MHAHEEPIAESGRPKVEQVRPKTGEGTVAPAGDRLTPSALLHLQRSAGNASVVQLLGEDRGEADPASSVKQVVGSGGGSPLDNATRRFMESRLGHDFSDVRLHTGPEATESARAVQANAYTVGNDVVFRSDQWSPNTDSGKRMLAHELTHVIQQKAGPVDGTPAAGGIKVSDPSDRFERQADEVADQVMRSEAPAVQRQEGPEEEEEQLQTSAVQRQEGAEAEEEELQASAVQRQEEEEEEGTELG